ncbi:MAG: ABC transporter ATP-binding protein [Proteobacteria bacterium]|nr:ABC transporter ATP-binding protein [Pseudomonadota bacterium]
MNAGPRTQGHGAAQSGELLRVEGLHVAYGEIEAVRDVSLSMYFGQVLTVIGANGAGKSTLLQALIGLLPYRGSISLEGRLIDHADVESRVRFGMNLVPEKRELFVSMTVEDNLILGAFHRRRLGKADRQLQLTEVYTRFPRLEERKQQLAGTLSGGERQMLAMGRAMMGQPKLLLLDEPSLGLAPRVVADVFRVIRDLKQAGVSILLVEQNARAALQVADYAYVMETGRVVLEGEAAALLNDQRLMQSYLGAVAPTMK